MKRWNVRLNDIATPPSVAIADRVRVLRAQGIKTFQMQTGEPAFDTPEYIKLAAFEALNRGDTHYCSSQGLPDLRQAISTMYCENYGFH